MSRAMTRTAKVERVTLREGVIVTRVVVETVMVVTSVMMLAGRPPWSSVSSVSRPLRRNFD